MIPRTLRVRYMSKLGLPNYSGVEAEVEMSYELEENDDIHAVIIAAFADVKANVLDNVRVAKAHVAEQQQSLGDGAYDKGNSRSSFR